ncbi:hypothetical protein LOK49_LG11G01229 [Camellia lanceoleosa]|uniref:Uncharacterized protein n=1 Tax=Camellia lanceoleosa TaxID=1840588 RepID=A0ACC0G1G8_9ERIC|nr:hypothetical protein LOK49_LG11G01229 [Camellia lanceoleosa]
MGEISPFSVVLVPSSVFPQASSASPESKSATNLARTLSRTISVFSSSAILFGKMGNERSFAKRNVNLDNKEKLVIEGQQTNNNNWMLNRIKSTYSRVYHIKSVSVLPTIDENSVNNLNKDLEVTSLRLSSRQISLLLSLDWAQSISPTNMPGNYEAIAYTYNLVLLFSRGKLFRCHLSAPLVARKQVDLFLHLVEDCKLQAVDSGSPFPKTIYGSKEDDSSASKSLSEIKITED